MHLVSTRYPTHLTFTWSFLRAAFHNILLPMAPRTLEIGKETDSSRRVPPRLHHCCGNADSTTVLPEMFEALKI